MTEDCTQNQEIQSKNELQKHSCVYLLRYPGPVDASNVFIRQGDLLLRRKSVFGRKQDLNEPLNAVFSTSNGAFLKNQKYWEMIESVEFAVCHYMKKKVCFTYIL